MLTYIWQADIAGKLSHPYKAIVLPNVLRLRILSARKLLNLPGLQPRVEVQVC